MHSLASATTTSQPTLNDREDELRLLAAVLNGDNLACRRFVQRYTCVIEARVRRILGGVRGGVSQEDVQDMVGEIWVSLLEDDMRPLRRFNPNRQIKVSTWIALLARNKTIDKLRTSHGCTVSIGEIPEGNEPASSAPLPSELLELQEHHAIASKAMQQLSPEDRRFLLAWYGEDTDPKELARRFGIAVGTVYSRRFKIQAKLTRAVKRVARPGRTTQRIMRY